MHGQAEPGRDIGHAIRQTTLLDRSRFDFGRYTPGVDKRESWYGV